MVKWSENKEEMVCCQAIAKKFCDIITHPNRPDIIKIAMDVEACHCNGNPLELERLLNAGEYDFIHDVAGIIAHIDRETGKLEDHFVPRFSVKA